MSTEKMREEFEAGFRNSSRVDGDQTYASAMLERGSDGEYRSFWIAGAWWAWQASRAAIEVELPPSPYMPDSEPDSMSGYEIGEAQGRCDMWAQCRESVESLGLKVKP